MKIYLILLSVLICTVFLMGCNTNTTVDNSLDSVHKGDITKPVIQRTQEKNLNPNTTVNNYQGSVQTEITANTTNPVVSTKKEDSLNPNTGNLYQDIKIRLKEVLQ